MSCIAGKSWKFLKAGYGDVCESWGIYCQATWAQEVWGGARLRLSRDNENLGSVQVNTTAGAFDFGSTTINRLINILRRHFLVLEPV